ncbi:MAG: DNRLRE domain-containing protein [Tepidisphaeraceae bacterium]
METRKLFDTTDLTPTDDTYVRSGIYAGDNFGDSIELVTKTSTPDRTRRAFFKFSLDQIGTELDGGKLRLHGYLADTVAPSVTISVHPVADLAWDEDTITWDTRSPPTTVPRSSPNR